MPDPNADHETIIAYTVEQYTTARDHDLTIRRFKRELQLTGGRLMRVVSIRKYPANPDLPWWKREPEEIKVWGDSE